MASTAIHHRRFFFFSILLGFLAVAANARPCKTIIFISSSSSSFPAENPNFLIQNPRFLTFYITEDREINPKPFISYKDHQFFQDRRPVKPSRFPVNFDASVGSSIRDRTLDIMSIVGALLFGVGCGALTAATMYLIWFLFSPNRFNFDGDSDGDSDDDESKDVYGDVSPKKMGYVAIQADTFVSPPAKQVE